ncbi:hypothetical protein THMIRHAS_00980 [Thiosulfatimonas sediminis]|uniref:DUF4381 domain-containing protein n=1 Tax=Thiosulfatimonas sediminis TaxID=2675054 RepID=A0A6F8PRI2_9GAMM|nr:DUF4381 domain-containing protein [Thiosulfatimonas sediminis]BBP44725.1 hypothetical protein THMIRHAS_00980 [Thiosulfatimonas sediminis]
MDPQVLQQLHDIQLPDPIGWWPLAFAWWILLLSVTSIIIGIIWYFTDQRRRNVYRRQAQRQLQQIMRQDSPDTNKILQINALLKQVAISAYGRRRVAALHQTQWLQFLQQNANYIPQPPSIPQHSDRIYAPPSQQTNELINAWHDYAKRWIKGHHQ